MKKRDHAEVIRECVTFFGNPATERSFDAAWDYVHELTFEEPEEAFSLLVELSKATSDRAFLSRLGAGPLESLLVSSRGRFIPEVIAEARRNSNFKTAVLDVWLDAESTPEALLEELEQNVPGFERYPDDDEEE